MNRDHMSARSVAFRKQVRDAFRAAGFGSPTYYNKLATGYSDKYVFFLDNLSAEERKKMYKKFREVAGRFGLYANFYTSCGPSVYIPNRE